MPYKTKSKKCQSKQNQEWLSNKRAYFYGKMSNKTNFNDFNVQFIQLNQTYKLENYILIGTAMVLLSIPAALLFHEILVLLGAIALDSLITVFIFKSKVENWNFFIYKPLLLWKAKILFLLHSLAGNHSK
jgi:hypothetical protein